MNAKNMKKHLAWKIEDWLKSIDDDSVRRIAEKNAIVTGGCFVSLLAGDSPKDYDVYFKTKEAVLAIAQYYVKKFNAAHPDEKDITVIQGDKDKHIVDDPDRIFILIPSKGVAGDVNEECVDTPFNEHDGNNAMLGEPASEQTKEDKEPEKKPPYRPVYLTSNAITLSDKVQLVIRFWGEVGEIHKNYDFVHCTCSYDHSAGKVELPQAALEAIINKELVYVGSRYPLSSIIRTRKFVSQGWKCNAGQYVKMCLQMDDLKLKDVSVLKDQLVGVDSAYFSMVIEAVAHKQETAEEGWALTNSYLFEIIDRIF